MKDKPKPLCDCGNLAIHHLIVKVGSGGNKFTLKSMELPLCERCYRLETKGERCDFYTPVVALQNVTAY